MKTTKALNLKTGEVILSDGSIKYLDSYVFELEDRLLKLNKLLKEYIDVDPCIEYSLTGEKIFEIMDILEDRK